MVSTNAPAAVVELVVTVTAVAGGACTTTFWVTLTTIEAGGQLHPGAGRGGRDRRRAAPGW
jgi:hypothetical protein